MAIPKDTVIPASTGSFAKIQEGNNRYRVLSDAVTGWEGWKDKKPFRHEGDVCKITAEQVDLTKDGKPNINYFWAMVVWSHADKRVQILEITQKTIMNALVQLEQNVEDFGDLKNYDIIINKSKVGDKTSYTVQGTPSKALTQEQVEAHETSEADLSKLFKGDYPIKEAEAEAKPEDIPF